MQFLRPMIGRADVECGAPVRIAGRADQGLEALALDVVLTNLPPARDAASRWLIHRIDEQPVGLIGRPARVGAPIAPLADLLRDQPLILPTRETALRVAFDALAARLGVTPLIAAEVDDRAMIRLLARADAGLAIIPPFVVQDELRFGSLTEAALLDGISETFLAVTLQRRFPNPLLSDVLGRAAPMQQSEGVPSSD
jgi:LysR family transcriptional activator of nhaA